MSQTILRALASILAVVFLAACATTAPPPDQRHPDDPWEPFNRNMYTFNRTLDKAIMRPIARGYTTVVPDPIERRVTNIFRNLASLPRIANLLLQGRPGDSARMLERFFVNSVFGLAGMFDVATKADIPNHNADFGQTLAVWGWDNSRYLMLPLLGPSTVRDGLGSGVDRFGDVLWREVIDGRAYIVATEIVQTRSNLLPRERQLENAFDEYLFVRDAWLQNRKFRITGEAETLDYDSFLDEDDDWDDWEEPEPDEQEQ
ncbi:MAG: VacJ family lipoprotein [Wenzhouxiangellaceae bacterium]